MINYLWKKIKVRFFLNSKVSTGKRFHLGILSYVSASKKLSIGDDVYIGKFCTIQVNGAIGDGVLIANNVGIVGRRDHNFREIGKFVRYSSWVGSDPDLASLSANYISIQSDVWIGFGATILSGIEVGRGAIIAAGSVVIRDVEPYSIVSGNPAQKIGVRFDKDSILKHEAIILKNEV